MSELARHFSPEFLNRVDDIILFKALTESEIEQIAQLLLNDLLRRLADRRITLDIGEAALRLIAHQGESKIGRALLGDEVPDSAVIHLVTADGELTITFDHPPPAEAAA